MLSPQHVSLDFHPISFITFIIDAKVIFIIFPSNVPNLPSNNTDPRLAPIIKMFSDS